MGLTLKQRSLDSLSREFGKSGKHYYNIVRGIQYSKVSPDRQRKSIAAERTFEENLSSEIYMLEKLDKISEELERRMKKSESSGKTITLKIKYSDFVTQTRSKTLDRAVSTKAEILPVIEELIFQEKMKESVRLLGISISNLNSKTIDQQISYQLKIDFKEWLVD